MDSAPLLSVVMTVYNGEAYLEEAIESILSQTFPEFEFIIINDGSLDRTQDIIQRYADGDPRIRFENREHIGRVEALNTCCRLANGKYVAIMDADDVALPDRFERQLDFLEVHPAVSLLGGGVQKISGEGRRFSTVMFPTEDLEIKKELMRVGCLAHSTVVMRRDAFEDVGGYRGAFPPAEDYDLWLRMAERHQLGNLPAVLVKYRVHSNQVSFTQLEAHVLTTLGAQLAARVRKERGIDPTAGVRQITREFLADFGIGKEMIDRTILNNFLALSVTLSMSGAQGASMRNLERCLEWAKAVGWSGGDLARIHAAFASGYFKQGRFLRCLTAVMNVFRGDPFAALALICRGADRLFRVTSSRKLESRNQIDSVSSSTG